MSVLEETFRGVLSSLEKEYESKFKTLFKGIDKSFGIRKLLLLSAVGAKVFLLPSSIGTSS